MRTKKRMTTKPWDTAVSILQRKLGLKKKNCNSLTKFKFTPTVKEVVRNTTV